MRYNPPYGSSDPNAPYVDRNTPGAVAGSKVPAAGIEHDQREIVNAIERSGQTPSENDLFQLWKAIQIASRGTIRAFTSSGTFVVPEGVTRIYGRVWAGGAGGGGTSGSAAAVGGGAGEYAEGSLTVTPGSSLPITVAGAVPGGGPGSAGTNGGSSSIGSLLSALGGTGGAGSTSGIASTGGAGGTSGSPVATIMRIPGYGGGYGIPIGSTFMGGAGGGSFSGFPPSPNVSANGNQGRFPGGGGNGSGGPSGQNYNGGNGAAGLVIIQY